MRFRSLTPARRICSARPSSETRRTLGELGVALLHPAVLGDALGLVAIGYDQEGVARVGHGFQAEDFDRSRRTGFFNGASAIVEHGADLAEGVADNVAVVEVQGAVLNQDGGHCAAAAVELGFQNRADGLAAGRGLGSLEVADQADHFQQQVKIDVLFGRNLDEDRAFAAGCPLFGNQAAIGELLFDALGVGVRLVDLVDGHDDGHFSGPGVVDGLNGLRHDAVVGGDHDHHNVGDLGAAGSHTGEGFVTGGVEEDDFAAGSRRAFLGELHLVSADVLSDAAGLAGDNVGFADGVQQRGLAVIDVAHDSDHGRTGNLELAGVIGFENFLDGLVGDLFLVADDGGGRAELGGDVLDHLGVEGLVDGDHDAAHQQGGDQVLGANI
jgi:hypothetical protein